MKSITFTIAAGMLFAAVSIAQQPHYTITDLGPVGATVGQAFHVTNGGLISGSAAVSSGAQHARIWYQGKEADIGQPGLGGLNSIAFSINNSVQAVGEADSATADPNGEDFCGFKALGLPTAGSTCLPFLWQSGVMTPLPTLGGNNGAANGINKAGVVAGIAETATPDPNCPAPQVLQFEPAVWTNGAIQALPTAAGDLDGVAFAINDHGHVAGASGQCSTLSPQTLTNLQPLHALLWRGGSAVDLGSLGGTGHGMGILALGLNNNGQVVGASDLPGDANFHGFLWSDENGMTDLGTLSGDVSSSALGINDAGEVVGVSLDANFNIRAFLRQHGQMMDLNSLISANSPWYLLQACSINDRGQIVGLAVKKSNGEAHTYLATPPE